MSTAASVFEVNAISNATQELSQIKNSSYDTCNDGLNQARQLLEETKTEEQTSRTMLDIANGVEMAKHAIVVELEVRLAAALADLAAVTPDPIGMATVGARIADIESQLVLARQEYEEAVRHREALERRYEMAVKAMNLAQERHDTLLMYFEAGKKSIEVTVDKGCARLNFAYQDLQKYVSRIAPDVRNKLDVDENVVDTILEYLYATDMGFRANIDSYCNEMKIGNEVGAELKIKKQMVGRLCEEIVIRAFKPISTQISTQMKASLPDGGYTKVDLIVYGLTNPLVLGRGVGMGAREGGSLAVEVKSGHSSYLYQQLSHMQDQAFGHKSCDASCVICTRDIHDLSLEKENELREKLREAGSPMIGMLPRKDDLDNRCINFVKGKLKDV